MNSFFLCIYIYMYPKKIYKKIDKRKKHDSIVLEKNFKNTTKFFLITNTLFTSKKFHLKKYTSFK